MKVFKLKVFKLKDNHASEPVTSHHDHPSQ
jgi:hypothetical protein